MRAKSIRRAHDVGMNVTEIARTGWTFGEGATLVQKGEDIQREAGLPGKDREKAPPLRQPFRTRAPGAIEREIPASAQADAIPEVGIARCAKQTRIIGRNGVIPLAEPRAALHFL